MLKFRIFQGRQDGWRSAENALAAVEKAADEATRWMNGQPESVVVSHVAAVAPGRFQVAHVVVWYRDEGEWRSPSVAAFQPEGRHRGRDPWPSDVAADSLEAAAGDIQEI